MYDGVIGGTCGRLRNVAPFIVFAHIVYEKNGSIKGNGWRAIAKRVDSRSAKLQSYEILSTINMVRFSLRKKCLHHFWIHVTRSRTVLGVCLRLYARGNVPESLRRRDRSYRCMLGQLEDIVLDAAEQFNGSEQENQPVVQSCANDRATSWELWCDHRGR